MKKQCLAMLALFAIPAAPLSTTAADLGGIPSMRGLAVSGSGSTYEGPGVYVLPGKTNPDVKAVKTDEALKGSAGAVVSGDRLFVAVPQGSFFVSGMTYNLWNTATWEIEKTSDGDTEFKANAMAAHPATGAVLGCFGESYSSTLTPFDINTFGLDEFEEKSINSTLYAMAYTAAGDLYGVDGNGTLYKYNPSSMFSPLNEVGDTGIRCDEGATAVIDPADGSMYLAQYRDDTSTMWRIDLSTASASKLYEVPGAMKIACLWLAPADQPQPGPEPVTPPYSETFTETEMPQGYININNNNDYSKWTFVPGTGGRPGYIVYDYNGAQAADDYIVLPPMRLEAARAYTFAFDARSEDAAHIERAAVYVGTAPEVAALTTEVMAPTDIEAVDSYASYDGVFVPATDGVYYFAVKACSDAAKFNLYVTNFRVSAPGASDIPVAVQSLAAIPAEYGELMVTLSFTAPVTDVAGKPLTALKHIEVKCGDKVLEEITAAPGAKISRDYTVDKAGTHTFTVTAYTQSGAGRPAATSCYVGFDVPVSPAYVSAIEGDNEGQLIVSWAPVDRDVRGMKMRGDQVTYTLSRITSGGSTVVASGLKTPFYTDQAIAKDGRQTFLRYSVVAVNNIGSSAQAVSEQLVAGKPYTLPFAESFANGYTSYTFAIEVDGTDEDTRWDTPTTAQLHDPEAQDGDNGLLRFIGSDGDKGTLTTGRINLAGTTCPTLSFYYYTSFGSDNTNTIEVQASTGGDFTSLRKLTLAGNRTWDKAVVDLSRYIGRTVQIRFIARTDYTRYVLLDNIRIADLFDCNLAAVALTGPSKVMRGRASTFALEIANEGALAANGYEVILKRDGVEADRVAGPAVEPDAKARVELSDVLSPFAADEVEYTAEIIMEADAYAANNISQPLPVAVMTSRHPVPSDLKLLAIEGNKLTLGWSAPVIEGREVDPETDGAEDYTPFSIGLSSSVVKDDNVGAWTMVDGDGKASYCARTNSSLIRLQYPNSEQPSAFQIFTPGVLDNIEPGFETHSGQQMWVCFNAKGGKTDDWLISPQLSGTAQTISFFAKSTKPNYGNESFEVLASSKGKETADFVLVKAVESVPGEWTKYEAELPAGTSYMAIRCTSNDIFALAIDDITLLTAEVAGTNLRLTGYRVYRNGEALGDVEATVNTYAATFDPEGSKHTYHVTALYNEGESHTSEGLEFDPAQSGISNVGVDSCGPRVLYNLQGIRVDEADATPGVYIEYRDGKARKVVL